MAKASKKTIKVTANRSAKTGEFVTKKFAKAHPNTTVKETIKRKT